MSYLSFKKEVKRGDIRPVYFMYGTQTFLMEDLLIDIIRETSLSQDDPNVISYSLQDTLLDIAVEEAETFPFFGGKKIVIIKDFSLVTAQKQDTKLEHDLNRLQLYIEHPSPETVMILLAPYEKLDERKKITKELKKRTALVECAPFDEKTLSLWLDGQAKTKGFEFTVDGKDSLLERVGPQLLLLASEVEKLALYVNGDRVVDREVVELLVARSLEQDVFALIDFAIKKQLDKALIIYHDLLKQREEPLKLLALIARQLRIYYQVKEMTKRSYSQKDMALQLKLHPYVVKLASQQINRFEEKQLLLLLEAAADTDYAIKSGKMEKTLAVELLLMKLSSLHARR
ncbi:DNA polymerase III subunit delta [Halalkalibacter akibai]|uniref:DNA polymerase III subunit delta n=1 Tax=Halalkalibacter akibai (strain ATCC 43226 / DSM 21942 / CIP 109018 / JCM 9157 / 1139) TaxID=1236973 RepID=W4QMK0_HALA3|nr:DNA polymerase III subunit delta [Halalkalibacter akibai]GAE33345.1 DNA polymerase III delta subunit [Halalkalibacter akibai JCM 9157]